MEKLNIEIATSANEYYQRCTRELNSRTTPPKYDLRNIIYDNTDWQQLIPRAVKKEECLRRCTIKETKMNIQRIEMWKNNFTHPVFGLESG